MTESSEQPISLSGFEGLGIDPETLGDFDLLAEGVFKILSENLGFVLHAVVMFDKESDGLRVINNTNHPTVEMILKKFLNKNIDELVFPLSENKNLLVKTYLEQKIVETDSVFYMAYPSIKRHVSNIIDKFIDVDLIVIVPLVVSGGSVGAIGLGLRGQNSFSSLEREFLLDLSNKMAPYFKSTWVLKKALEKNELLRKHKKDLEELVKIKQDFLLDVSDLLSGLTSEFGIQEEKREDIKDALRYLKSLFLLSESVAKRDRE